MATSTHDALAIAERILAARDGDDEARMDTISDAVDLAEAVTAGAFRSLDNGMVNVIVSALGHVSHRSSGWTRTERLGAAVTADLIQAQGGGPAGDAARERLAAYHGITERFDSIPGDLEPRVPRMGF